ncbi:MAG: glycosyltransferase [Chloroflexi bacterium]|nr:glycosyltransferase [Chloroflexota bacterium]
MAHWLAEHGHEVEVFAVENLIAPDLRLDTAQQDGLIVHRVFYNLKAEADTFRSLYDYAPLGTALREVLTRRPFDLVHLISGYLLGGQVITIAKDLGLPVIVSPMEYFFLCARLNLIQPTGDLCTGPDSDRKCARCLMQEKRRYRLPTQIAPGVANVVLDIAQTVSSFGEDLTVAVQHRRQYLTEALNAVDRVICNSEFLIHKFAEFGFDTRRFIYIRQGLVTSNGGKPSRQTLSDGTLRLGYIGQIKYHKGVDLLVDAVTTLLRAGKSVSLDLWGNETEEPKFTETLKKRSAGFPTIRWNGRYVGSKVWDVLAGLDTLVIPSRWYENSPNVILEAFEMGLPVIVTHLGGMAELVNAGENGLVFRLNDMADLMCQITRLLDEPGLLERLRAGIPRVKTIDEEMQEIVAQYDQVLQERVGQR